MSPDSRPLLTIVTVVFNDPEGVKVTLDSVRDHLDVVEHWVIDGSTDDRVRAVLENADPRVQWLSEPDRGLYDAMNKGLDRASGMYALMLNAGDTLVAEFDPRRFLSEARDRVTIGYTIERHEDERFLRPARGREAAAFAAPSHPGTAYPRCCYADLRYRLDLPIGADGDLTGRSIDRAGAVFVREVVSIFDLGGRSSSYGDIATVRGRLLERPSLKSAAKLGIKTALWRLLPRRYFYRLLAAGRYDRLAPDGTSGVASDGAELLAIDSSRRAASGSA